jgi:hypothetical protein
VVNSDPSIGTGRGLPDSSGRPSFMRIQVRAFCYFLERLPLVESGNWI